MMPSVFATKGKALGGLLLEAFYEWVRDRCTDLAAALAFNAVLAAVPFMATVLVVAVWLLGEHWVAARMLPALLAWAGPRGTEALKSLLHEQAGADPWMLLSLGVVGLLGVLWGAVGFFGQLRDALQTIWNVRREEARIGVQLRKRLGDLGHAAVSGLIVFAALALVSLIYGARPPAVPRPRLDVFRSSAEVAAAFLMFWALGCYWFRVMVPVRLTWGQVGPWAALAAVLHMAGRGILTWRVTKHGSNSSANAAEDLILLLLWFQYAGMVFLYAAQLMRVHLQQSGQARPLAAAPGPGAQPTGAG